MPSINISFWFISKEKLLDELIQFEWVTRHRLPFTILATKTANRWNRTYAVTVSPWLRKRARRSAPIFLIICNAMPVSRGADGHYPVPTAAVAPPISGPPGSQIASSLFGSPPPSAFPAQRTGHPPPPAPPHGHASVSLHSAAFSNRRPRESRRRRLEAHRSLSPPQSSPPFSTSYGLLGGGGGRRGDRSPVPPPRSVVDRRAQPPCGVPSASAPQSQVTSRLLWGRAFPL